MNGPYIVSLSGGAPCHRCGTKLATGQQVFYVGSLLDDTGRTCSACVDVDLFGSAA